MDSCSHGGLRLYQQLACASNPSLPSIAAKQYLELTLPFVPLENRGDKVVQVFRLYERLLSFVEAGQGEAIDRPFAQQYLAWLKEVLSEDETFQFRLEQLSEVEKVPEPITMEAVDDFCRFVVLLVLAGEFKLAANVFTRIHKTVRRFIEITAVVEDWCFDSMTLLSRFDSRDPACKTIAQQLFSKGHDLGGRAVSGNEPPAEALRLGCFDFLSALACKDAQTKLDLVFAVDLNLAPLWYCGLLCGLDHQITVPRLRQEFSWALELWAQQHAPLEAQGDELPGESGLPALKGFLNAVLSALSVTSGNEVVAALNESSAQLFQGVTYAEDQYRASFLGAHVAHAVALQLNTSSSSSFSKVRQSIWDSNNMLIEFIRRFELNTFQQLNRALRYVSCLPLVDPRVAVEVIERYQTLVEEGRADNDAAPDIPLILDTVEEFLRTYELTLAPSNEHYNFMKRNVANRFAAVPGIQETIKEYYQVYDVLVREAAAKVVRFVSTELSKSTSTVGYAISLMQRRAASTTGASEGNVTWVYNFVETELYSNEEFEVTASSTQDLDNLLRTVLPSSALTIGEGVRCGTIRLPTDNADCSSVLSICGYLWGVVTANTAGERLEEIVSALSGPWSVPSNVELVLLAMALRDITALQCGSTYEQVLQLNQRLQALPEGSDKKQLQLQIRSILTDPKLRPAGIFNSVKGK